VPLIPPFFLSHFFGVMCSTARFKLASANLKGRLVPYLMTVLDHCSLLKKSCVSCSWTAYLLNMQLCICNVLSHSSKTNNKFSSWRALTIGIFMPSHFVLAGMVLECWIGTIT
jgi:hypothetical protein